MRGHLELITIFFKDDFHTLISLWIESLFFWNPFYLSYSFSSHIADDALKSPEIVNILTNSTKPIQIPVNICEEKINICMILKFYYVKVINWPFYSIF
jgi:hypothetical protein